jgi:cytoskeletal protein CcmA (bactofilin family)
MQTEKEMSEETAVPGRLRHRTDGHASGNLTLGARDSLVGKLTFEGDVKIVGHLEGEVKASGDVSVDDGGTVKANVEGNNVSVRGNLTGNVTTKGKLSVGGAGAVHGDVKVGRLSVEDGGTLNGNVSMMASGHGSSSASESTKATPAGSG